MSDHEEWSARAGIVALTWVATALAAAWCTGSWVTRTDPAGGLIAGAATLGLATFAIFGTRARPRLAADADGVTIGGVLRRRHHPWPLVRGIRVLRVRRFGRESSLLEIDTSDAAGGERLYVLGRLDLGEDPEDVAAALSAHRP